MAEKSSIRHQAQMTHFWVVNIGHVMSLESESETDRRNVYHKQCHQFDLSPSTVGSISENEYGGPLLSTHSRLHSWQSLGPCQHCAITYT